MRPQFWQTVGLAFLLAFLFEGLLENKINKMTSVSLFFFFFFFFMTQ